MFSDRNFDNMVDTQTPLLEPPILYLGLGRRGPFFGKKITETCGFVEKSVPHEAAQDLLRGELFLW